MALERAQAPAASLDASQLLNALPQPLLAIDASGVVREVNIAAEHFFDSGRSAWELRSVIMFGEDSWVPRWLELDSLRDANG